MSALSPRPDENRLNSEIGVVARVILIVAAANFANSQCGFASREAGNPITVDDQTARLSLVVRVATDVRGGVLPSRG